MHAYKITSGLLAGLVAAAIVVLPDTAQAGFITQTALVNTLPRSTTPNMKTGYIVHEQAVIGDTAYVGGQFTQFEDSTRTITYDRQNFLAYTISTGAVTPLLLNTNGDVNAMIPSDDGTSLYIGGNFTTVNGVTTSSLVKLNVATGTLDTSFHWKYGFVYALQYSQGLLYVGGSFAKRLLAISPATGIETTKVVVTVAGTLGTSGGAVRVAKFAINPAGTDLVAIGNFTAVNGVTRRSAFRLDLTTTPATLTPWHPTRFDGLCAPSIAYYLRDVAYSPDGSYFGIVSTGGPYGGYPATGFCDAIGRWDATLPAPDPLAQPTWINWTGGDSVYTLALSGVAYYTGGHNRWLDNPQGHDSAGPGAYEVDSVGAIDPATGLAIKTWNVLNCTRGHGKEDLTLFPGGLLVGGDGTLVKGRYHNAISLLPLP